MMYQSVLLTRSVLAGPQVCWYSRKWGIPRYRLDSQVKRVLGGVHELACYVASGTAMEDVPMDWIELDRRAGPITLDFLRKNAARFRPHLLELQRRSRADMGDEKVAKMIEEMFTIDPFDDLDDVHHVVLWFRQRSDCKNDNRKQLARKAVDPNAPKRPRGRPRKDAAITKQREEQQNELLNASAAARLARANEIIASRKATEELVIDPDRMFD